MRCLQISARARFDNLEDASMGEIALYRLLFSLSSPPDFFLPMMYKIDGRLFSGKR